MRRVIFFAGLAAIASAAAFGQSKTIMPTFESASVKLTAAAPGGAMARIMSGGPGTDDPGEINYLGVTLKRLVVQAYGVKDYQISGPDWLDTQRYDVAAKLPPNTTQQQFALMLQSLLADRFKLKVHREQKELPVYALSVAGGGPKLKESAAGAGAAGGTSKTSAHDVYRLTATRESMAQFADALAAELGKPVIDMTGLKGSYDFVFDWPLQSTAAIPSALESQLGLKLESRNSPVDFLIVDHAEKIPAAN